MHELESQVGSAQAEALAPHLRRAQALGYGPLRGFPTEEAESEARQALGAAGYWPTSGVPSPFIYALFDSLVGVFPRNAIGLQVGSDLAAAIESWMTQVGMEHGLDAWLGRARSAWMEGSGLPPWGVAVGDRASDVLGQPPPKACGYRITLHGVAVAEGEAFPGLDLLVGGPGRPLPPGPYRLERDPIGEGEVAWLRVGPGAVLPNVAERLHWMDAVARHLAWVVRKESHRLLMPDDVEALLAGDTQHGANPQLLRYLSLGELTLVLRAWLRQGLSLELLGQVVEALTRHVLKALASGGGSPAELEAFARGLPRFPTDELVAVARRAVGLPPMPSPLAPWVDAGLPLPGPPAPGLPDLVAKAKADQLLVEALRLGVASTLMGKSVPRRGVGDFTGEQLASAVVSRAPLLWHGALSAYADAARAVGAFGPASPAPSGDPLAWAWALQRPRRWVEEALTP